MINDTSARTLIQVKNSVLVFRLNQSSAQANATVNMPAGPGSSLPSIHLLLRV